MKKFLILIVVTVFMSSANAALTRLKDAVNIKGVRENPIIGYGLVIGLNGTGDSGGEITNIAMKRMFQKLGLNPKQEISSKNIASVIVTAKMPSFARIGQTLDITISSIGDASSLAGGTLLVTPLKGGNGSIYALANGHVSIGGLVKGAKFATTGRIPNGATVERELGIEFDKKEALRLNLNRPDFTTAARIEKVLNENLGGRYATARDSSTVDLIVPTNYHRSVIKLIAIIENLKVNTDQVARIIINERTGTIVAGGDISLREVAISHGDLTIQVGGEGQTQSTNGSSVFLIEKKSKLKDLVEALNAYGAKPEDLISIFQALKANGSLLGDIETI